MKIEKWAIIPSLGDNYMISNKGRIKSLSRFIKCRGGSIRYAKEIILKQRISKKGYWVVTVTVNKKVIAIYRHLEMARAFIPNPEGKSEVNHKDGVRHNSVLTNLEWVTPSENVTHSYRVLGRKAYYLGIKGADHPLSKPVFAFNKKTKERFSAVSIREAATKIGTYDSLVGRVVDKHNRTVRGFTIKSI